jgi:hypothetical protein
MKCESENVKALKIQMPNQGPNRNVEGLGLDFVIEVSFDI